VLAPGDPEAPLQLIDARDLGSWLVRAAAERTGGVFNATGPERPLTLRETLERVSAAVGGDANLVWTDERRVLDAGVQPWMELPLWLPGDEHDELMRADIGRALAAGLAFRPLEETARDTLDWSRATGAQARTLSRDREREILTGA
jgi:2'-hydroxyisoflavone reductase